MEINKEMARKKKSDEQDNSTEDTFEQVADETSVEETQEVAVADQETITEPVEEASEEKSDVDAEVVPQVLVDDSPAVVEVAVQPAPQASDVSEQERRRRRLMGF
jgi:hypothetical protein